MIHELITIGIVLLVLDAGWLTLQADTIRTTFAAIQGQPLTIRLLPACLVYVILAGAIYVFSTRESKSVSDAAIRGAGIGFAMYGVYDMTNHATLRNYPAEFAIQDILWGTTLCATAAACSKWIQ
jgi:uncharacterized membrane protein